MTAGWTEKELGEPYDPYGVFWRIEAYSFPVFVVSVGMIMLSCYVALASANVPSLENLAISGIILFCAALITIVTRVSSELYYSSVLCTAVLGITSFMLIVVGAPVVYFFTPENARECMVSDESTKVCMW